MLRSVSERLNLDNIENRRKCQIIHCKLFTDWEGWIATKLPSIGIWSLSVWQDMFWLFKSTEKYYLPLNGLIKNYLCQQHCLVVIRLQLRFKKWIILRSDGDFLLEEWILNMLFSIHDIQQGFQLWWWLQICIEFSIACCNKIRTKLTNMIEVWVNISLSIYFSSYALHKIVKI